MSDYYFDNDVNDYDDELKDILNTFLFREIRLSLPNKYRVEDFDMELIPVYDRRSAVRTRKLMSSRRFLLSGKLLIITDVVPPTDSVDEIILGAFSGQPLSLCLELLHSAKNAEIRSIHTIQASMFESSGSTVKSSSAEDAVPKNTWYSWYSNDMFLIIVISAAGLCLVLGLAAILVAVRRSRERERLSHRERGRSSSRRKHRRDRHRNKRSRERTGTR